MGATFSRIKNWIAETLTYADLNAEIDNILTYLTPAGVDDYSTNATAMRTQTDPGESGTESLATSLAGELERLRFAIQEIKGTGTTYWYQTAASSIGELASALGTSVLANRISSGRVRTGSSQPLFLVPNGAARTVTLAGATTPFVFYYESTAVTISSNVTATGLTAAPGSNNTALINMPGTNDEAWTKMCGEYGSTIQVDAMGTEISNLTGKLAGFKLAGAGTEYFIARVDSATQLSNARRGYFFDSADAPIPRTAFTDNDTITLMKLTFIYAKSDGTIQPGYTNPTVSADEPTSPAVGDYWYDLSAAKWKYYSGAWADLDGILVGICLQDTTNTVAARGFDFFKNFASLNTANLTYSSATTVISQNTDAELSVYGTSLKQFADRMSWSTATDFDSGVSEAASTHYFLYVKESGDRVLSDLAPFDRTADLRGLYHPFHTWRCLGQVYNNASQDFVAVIDYADDSPSNYKVTTQVGSSALTVILHANPLSQFRMNSQTTTDVTHSVQVPCAISLVVPSTASLGHSSANAHPIHVYIARNLGTPYLAVQTGPFDDSALVTTTAMSTGADVNYTMYSVGALTSVPCRLVARMSSTQATAGTWATAPTAVVNVPFRIEKVKVHYTETSNSVANNSETTFAFGTRVQDNYAAMNSGSGVFTSPVAGTYSVTAMLTSAGGGGWDVGERWTVKIRVGGADWATALNTNLVAHAQAMNTMVTALVTVAAATEIVIRIYQNSGGSLAIDNVAAENFVSIQQVDP